MERILWIAAAVFTVGLVPYFLWRSVVHARLGLEPVPNVHREEMAYKDARERAAWLTALAWLVWPIVVGYVAVAAFGRWWVRREITKPTSKSDDRETYR